MNAMSEVFSSGPSRRTRLIKRALLAFIFLGAAAAATGCGPVQSTQRISQAEVAFERARVVEAHEKAPYEYKSAQYYLHKAKEEWGYSDFEAAYDYATEAKSAAEAARLKAKEDPWPGHPILGKEEIEDMKSEMGPEGYDDEEASETGPEGYMEEDDEEGGESDGSDSP
jgi:hypothetical protein